MEPPVNDKDRIITPDDMRAPTPEKPENKSSVAIIDGPLTVNELVLKGVDLDDIPVGRNPFND